MEIFNLIFQRKFNKIKKLEIKNVKDECGNTYLHSACHHEHYEMIKFFYKISENPSQISISGFTCLHLVYNQSISYKNYHKIQMIKFLISKIELNIRDSDGYVWSNSDNFSTQEPIFNLMCHYNQNIKLRDRQGFLCHSICKKKLLNLPICILNDI